MDRKFNQARSSAGTQTAVRIDGRPDGAFRGRPVAAGIDRTPVYDDQARAVGGGGFGVALGRVRAGTGTRASGGAFGTHSR